MEGTMSEWKVKLNMSSFTNARKKLEDTQRALITKRMSECVTSASSSLGNSNKTMSETTIENLGKRKPCGYLTLLDLSVLSGVSIPESSIMHSKEFVPNSFHQQSHVSRWRQFVKTTPKWILKMGMESLDEQRNTVVHDKQSNAIADDHVDQSNINPSYGTTAKHSSCDSKKSSCDPVAKTTLNFGDTSSRRILKMGMESLDEQRNTVVHDKQSNAIADDHVDQSNINPSYGTTAKHSSRDSKKSSCDPVAKTTLNFGGTSSRVNQYILQRWTPVFVQPSSLKVQGYLQSTSSPEVFHTTDIMKVRKGHYSFQCRSGAIYVLQGRYVDPTNTIPIQIQKKLNRGLPVRWKLMLQEWATIKGPRGETEIRDADQTSVTVTNHIDHDETAESGYCYENSNEKQSVGKGAAMVPRYRSGSRIQLAKLDGQGVVQTSSKGRIILPPVKYWLGERLVQEDGKAVLFCPKLGVTDVVNHRDASMEGQKKRQHSESEVGTLAPSKKRHVDEYVTSDDSKNKFKRPTKGTKVLSRNMSSGRGREPKFGARERLKGPNFTDHFKEITSKKVYCSRTPLHIYDSEEDLLDGFGDELLLDLPVDTNYKAISAFSDLSVGSASPPTKYFNSMLAAEDLGSRSPSPELPVYPQHKKKQVDMFIKRQQKIIEKDIRRPRKTTSAQRLRFAEKIADKLERANEHINRVFNIQLDEVADTESIFDDDLSGSYVSYQDV